MYICKDGLNQIDFNTEKKDFRKMFNQYTLNVNDINYLWAFQQAHKITILSLTISLVA